MTKVQRHHRIYFIVLLLAAGAFIGNWWAIRSLDVFGSPLFFATGLLVQVLVAIVILYSAVVAIEPLLEVMASIMVSAWQGITQNRYVRRFDINHQRLVAWLGRRFNPKHPTGLGLTAGLVVAATLLGYFLAVMHGVNTSSPLSAADTRILNLLPSIRTPAQNRFFIFMTFWGNWQTIYLVTVLAVGYLYSKKQRLTALTIAAAMIIEELSLSVLKRTVGRARPDVILSLVKTDTLSFPSGHVLAGTILYGLIAYLLFKSAKRHFNKLGIILVAVVVLFLISLSRIYLGVHYPSDVMASLLFGAAILAVAITGLEIVTRFQLFHQSKQSLVNRRLAWLPALLVAWSLIASPVLVKTLAIQPVVDNKVIANLGSDLVQQLPLYSETLTGAHMEPINFVYVGSQRQIEGLFKRHGWQEADRLTFYNSLRAFAVGVQNKSYVSAPMTPSYLNGRPNDLAFERPEKTNTIRQRHHTRLWRTNLVLADGRPVWVATASFDEGIKLTPGVLIPTHHINANVDAERDYILDSFGISRPRFLRVVGAQLGTNAAGDYFFTDGRAALIEL